MAGLMALAPASLHAAQLFTPPEGCEVFLTVQMNQCRVEHHYECAASGTDRWRIVYLEEGPVFLSRIDAEAQWVSSVDLPTGNETVTVLPPRDPASVSNLLATGADTFDFDQRRADGSIERIRGEDRIVERNVLIDGEVLNRTAFTVTYETADGQEIGRYTGAEYVSDTHRKFFAGRGTSLFDGVQSSFDRTPREFIYPGEAGFASVVPLYDCGEMISALEVRS
ncbi:hypothetical protein [Sagittula sp. S175]|uniref:hypothetical protein n=1 Tax=Sagittula sp. S175 TaxID=3415129 RepID=UPI003C79AC15